MNDDTDAADDPLAAYDDDPTDDADARDDPREIGLPDPELDEIRLRR